MGTFKPWVPPEVKAVTEIRWKARVSCLKLGASVRALAGNLDDLFPKIGLIVLTSRI